MHHTERLTYLFNLYTTNSCTADELNEFWNLLAALPKADVLEPEMQALWSKQRAGIKGSDKVDWKSVEKRIWGEVRSEKPGEESWEVSRFFKSSGFRYAAALTALMVGAILFTFVFNNRKSGRLVEEKPVPAGGNYGIGNNNATLTLADGSTIQLDSLAADKLAMKGNTRIVKLNSGSLAFKVADDRTEEKNAVTYNTICTPRGRQYEVELHDGSRIWLNAESSIRFPTTFVHDRKVEITGEVYFEVAKNAKLPFRVKLNNNTEIEVLGTHFNINTYLNEGAISTTLLEGSIRINGGGKQKVLEPGQQARIRTADIAVTDNVDIEEVIAWKTGLFFFKKANLQTVMRQVERWYDVEVVYEGAVPAREFQGKMGRDLQLSQMLKIFKKMDVHVRLEGKKLIVLP